MNKYYTPEITEFHVGLEYQVLDVTKRDYRGEFACKKDFLGKEIPCDTKEYKVLELGWKDRVFDTHTDIPKDEIQWTLVKGIMEPLLSTYRVKYLDREDIESLGFKFDEENKDEVIYTIGNMMDGEYNLIYDKYTYKLNIFNLMGNKNDISFDGYIKNKAELRKLLKQLKIID